MYEKNAYLNAYTNNGQVSLTKEEKDEIRRFEFSTETKDTLAKRVAYRCSCPQCGIITIGPGDELDKVTMYGEAAHIIGAINNKITSSPRADITKTEEDIKSIDNAIWLCKNHHKLVDSKTSKYTVEVLRKWKKDAEKAQEEELEQARNKLIEKYLYKSFKTDKGINLANWKAEQWCIFVYAYEEQYNWNSRSLYFEDGEVGFTEIYQKWLGENSINIKTAKIEFDKTNYYYYGSRYIDSIKSVLTPMTGVLYLSDDRIKIGPKFAEILDDLIKNLGDSIIEQIKEDLRVY